VEQESVISAAQLVVDGLARDVSLASTREEHVRLTARLNEAVSLLNALSSTRAT
jgi:hypothetical protein